MTPPANPNILSISRWFIALVAKTRAAPKAVIPHVNNVAMNACVIGVKFRKKSAIVHELPLSKYRDKKVCTGNNLCTIHHFVNPLTGFNKVSPLTSILQLYLFYTIIFIIHFSMESNFFRDRGIWNSFFHERAIYPGIFHAGSPKTELESLLDLYIPGNFLYRPMK